MQSPAATESAELDWRLAQRVLRVVVSVGRPWLALFDGDVALAASWRALTALAPPAVRGGRVQPLTVVALARHLGQPASVVTRWVRELEEFGWCHRTPAGLTAHTPTASRELIRAAETLSATAFNTLIRDMAAEAADNRTPGALEPFAGELQRADSKALRSAYAGFALRTLLDSAMEVSAARADPLIVSTAAKMREEAARGQDASLDSLGSAVSASALSQKLRLDPETVRRRIDILIARGVLLRRGEAVALPESWSLPDPYRMNAQSVVRGFYDMQRELAATLFARPSSPKVRGRPSRQLEQVSP